MERYTGLLGLVVIVVVAYLFSNDRRAIKPRVFFWGLGLQFAFAFLVLRTNFGFVFQAISNGVNHMLEYSVEGSKFIFGDKLGVKNDQFGVIFAFQVLPIIIFIASFFAILYYLGVMQIFVRGMALLMQRVFGTSGAESTNVAASIFMGQTEAPLTIRPFLSNLTTSEWGNVFGDPVVATAILDRLLHHSHVVTIRGDSYRLREKRKSGLLRPVTAAATAS